MKEKKKVKKEVLLKPAVGSAILRPRKIKVRVVGIGGGGISIISEMAAPQKSFFEADRKALNNSASFVAVDTDSRVFQRAKKNIRGLLLGEKLVKGLGTGMDIEIAHRAAQEEKEKLTKIFQDQDIVILVGCLGGGVASGAGPVLASLAQENKNIALGIFTLPFGFEGDKKLALAKRAAERLRENLSGIIVVPNEKIFQLVDKKTPLKKSLSALNQVFAAWLNGLLEIILKPNLINIDFADLKTILETKGANLFFGQALAQGQNRAEEAVKQLFNNQLLDGAPKAMSRVLFNITGGKDLNIKEVEIVSQSVCLLNPKAKIIFGLSQDQKYNGKIKVVLLAVSQLEKKKVKDDITETKKGIKEKNLKNAKHKLVKINKSEKAAIKNNKRQDSLTNGKIAAAKAGVTKATIRQTGLEIVEAQKAEAQKELVQESNWEIPAFLKKRME